jgi:hypothetical protein
VKVSVQQMQYFFKKRRINALQNVENKSLIGKNKELLAAV